MYALKNLFFQFSIYFRFGFKTFHAHIRPTYIYTITSSGKSHPFCLCFLFFSFLFHVWKQISPTLCLLFLENALNCYKWAKFYLKLYISNSIKSTAVPAFSGLTCLLEWLFIEPTQMLLPHKYINKVVVFYFLLGVALFISSNMRICTHLLWETNCSRSDLIEIAHSSSNVRPSKISFSCALIICSIN